MFISKKVAAIGAAGIVALGGAGLYAGSMTVSTTGTLGAGSVAVQASCTSTVNITPGEATWNETALAYTYSSVSVVLAGDHTCDGLVATVNVYDDTSGAQEGVGTYTIVGDEAADTFEVDLEIPPALTLPAQIDAGLPTGDYQYGIVIQ